MAHGKDNQQIDSQQLDSQQLDSDDLSNPGLEKASEDRDDQAAPAATEDGLYFFPEDDVTEARARALLTDGTAKERAWVVSHLLRYAQWDDIWTYIDRDAARADFDQLDLPESLRAAWARMLKIEASVS